MENVRLERAPFFPFSDPIIPLALLRLVSTQENYPLDWNAQENVSLPCELWVGTNDFNTKKDVLVRSNPRIIFLSGN